MFTGLVEATASVLQVTASQTGKRLVLTSPFTALQEGESIAVQGVCLTRLPGDEHTLTFDVSPETLARTTLGGLESGQLVNLERAMQAQARFGGHYVTGHVDTTACLLAMERLGEFWQLRVGAFASQSALYLLEKGSITLDGVSLTINAVEDGTIQLMLVPHTLAQTTLGQLSVGHRFNVEFDYLTRIVAHQLSISGQLKNEVI